MENIEPKIISQCQAGQTVAFEKLYELYFERIYKFIYFKTHHRETAEDLTSDTFGKVLEHLSDFDSSKGTLSAWIYAIARNTVIDFHRIIHRETMIEDAWGLAGNDETDIDNKLFFERVKPYLSKLKSEQREILMMRIWQELSYKEIAEILGKSEASCKMVFSRSVAELRRQLPTLIIFILLLKFGGTQI